MAVAATGDLEIMKFGLGTLAGKSTGTLLMVQIRFEKPTFHSQSAVDDCIDEYTLTKN
jgi:hypothetical protein